MPDTVNIEAEVDDIRRVLKAQLEAQSRRMKTAPDTETYDGAMFQLDMYNRFYTVLEEYLAGHSRH